MFVVLLPDAAERLLEVVSGGEEAVDVQGLENHFLRLGGEIVSVSNQQPPPLYQVTLVLVGLLVVSVVSYFVEFFVNQFDDMEVVEYLHNIGQVFPNSGDESLGKGC